MTFIRYLFLLIFAPLAAWANPTVTVGELTADAGEKISGYLSFPGAKEARADIPVTIINGAGEGPVLALIAGVHGMETAPQRALHIIRKEIDPAKLNGTVLIVHRMNCPGYRARVSYLNPVDGENMNRVFPGDARGTLSFRAARVVTDEIMTQADYVIDMHAGDGNEDLAPYIYLTQTGKPEQDAATIALARAFGIGRYLPLTVTEADYAEPKYTDYTAAVMGIPAITTETGNRGEAASWAVDLAVEGVKGVLADLGMAGTPRTAPKAPEVWLKDAHIERAQMDGFFMPTAKGGDMVAEAQILGVLYDPFGEEIATITAPFNGWLNYIMATPPANAGDALAMISKIGEAPSVARKD